MENPGPGSYGQLESMHYIKNRETFNKSKREICETKAIDLIGPGSYDTDSKKEMTVPMEQPNFRSGLLRPWNVQKAIDNRFGMYDIAQCDISRKVVNKKLFLEKLKKISV